MFRNGFLLAAMLMLSLIGCAPRASESAPPLIQPSQEQPVSEPEPAPEPEPEPRPLTQVFNAYVNGKKVPVNDGVWVHNTPAYSFAFSLDGSDQLAPQAIEFSLLNRSQNLIRILWDDSVIIFPSGASTRVFHIGVKFSEANESQPPTIVAPNARVDDLFSATDGLRFSDVLGEWIEPSLVLLPQMSRASWRLFTTLEVNGANQTADINFVSKAIDK